MIIAIIIIFFGTSLSVYNSFYFILFISFFLIRELISVNMIRLRVWVFSFFLLISLLTLLFNIFPHMLFKSNNYFTYDYMTRNFSHSTVYGISIVEFFTPVLDHVNFVESKQVNHSQLTGRKLKKLPIVSRSCKLNMPF